MLVIWNLPILRKHFTVNTWRLYGGFTEILRRFYGAGAWLSYAFLALKADKQPAMSGFDKKKLADDIKVKCSLPRGARRAVPYIKDYPEDPRALPRAGTRPMGTHKGL